MANHSYNVRNKSLYPKCKSSWRYCCTFLTGCYKLCVLTAKHIVCWLRVGPCVIPELSLSLFAAAWVREEKEGGGQESKSGQTASVGHVVLCLWETPVLQHQRPGGYHQTACGKTRGQHEGSGLTSNNTIASICCSLIFPFHAAFSDLMFFFSPDLLEGNLAWYRHLQREGNTQEHVGAQTRIPTLPRRGKDWRIVSDPTTRPIDHFFIWWGDPYQTRPWLDLVALTWSPSIRSQSELEHEVKQGLGFTGRSWIFLLFCRKQIEVFTLKCAPSLPDSSSTRYWGKTCLYLNYLFCPAEAQNINTLVLSIELYLNVLTSIFTGKGFYGINLKESKDVTKIMALTTKINMCWLNFFLDIL